MSFDRLVLPLLTLAVIALGLGVFLPVVEVRNLVAKPVFHHGNGSC